MNAITFTMWDYALIAMAIIALAGVLWAIDFRRWIGSKVAKLLPKDDIQQGDKVHIYLNGKLNRTASLSRVGVDSVCIYDTVKLPLNYRGRFYGMGIDTNDGSKVIYITKHRYFRLIRIAELIRKVFGLLDDDSNLIPDYSEQEQTLNALAAEEGEGNEM